MDFLHLRGEKEEEKFGFERAVERGREKDHKFQRIAQVGAEPHLSLHPI